MAIKPIKIITSDGNQDDLTLLKTLINEAFPEAVVLSSLHGQKGLDIEITQTNEYFETILNTNPDAAMITLLNDGIIVNINEVFSTITGYCRSEVLGKSALELELYAERTDYLKIVNKLKENGYCMGEELVFRRADKSIFNGLISAKIITLKGVEYIVTNVHDITNRHDANMALQESEERYKSLFEYSGVGIGCYTTDGVAISYNKKAIENLGGKLEDYVGKSIRVLFSKELSDMLFARIEKSINEDQPREYEDFMDLNTGAKYFSSIITNIKNFEGTVVGVQIVSLDITERKYAEKALYESEKNIAIILKMLLMVFLLLTKKDGM